jgi:hypothetical protein
MMSNAWVTMGFDKLILLLEVNPLTKFWCTIKANQVFCHVFFEYIKLVEIVVVHVFGSMEDEQCISSLSFLKNKFRNALNPHL